MIICHRLYDLLVGGAEVVVLNTVQALPDCEHHVYFNRYRESWISRSLERQANVRLHQIQGATAPAELSEDADMYFFHYYPPMGEADFRDLSSRVLARSVLVNHWCENVPRFPRLRYVFLSEHSRRRTGAAIPDHDCYIVMNPVPENQFEVNERPPDRCVIGRHSRDVPIKFSHDFFDIFENYHVAPLEVTVLGAPGKMVEFVSRNLEKLRHNYWLLPFNSMAVSKYLRAIDLFVYKTRDDFEETCPMNILEAMASGLPVVAERKGGIINLVQHGRTGILCDTLGDYHEAIDQLRQDPDRRRELGRQGREWISECASVQRFREGIVKVWSDVARFATR